MMNKMQNLTRWWPTYVRLHVTYVRKLHVREDKYKVCDFGHKRNRSNWLMKRRHSRTWKHKSRAQNLKSHTWDWRHVCENWTGAKQEIWNLKVVEDMKPHVCKDSNVTYVRYAKQDENLFCLNITWIETNKCKQQSCVDRSRT